MDTDLPTRLNVAPEGTFPAKVAAQRAGISVRQLDHWATRGWLTAVGGGRQGHPRYLSETEVEAARIMGGLVRGGVTPAAAAVWAHDLIAGRDVTVAGYRLERAA